MHLSGKGRFIFQALPGNTALCSSSSYTENAIKCLLNILRQLRLLRKSSEIKNGNTLQALTGVPLLREFLENSIWQADPLRWPTSKILCTLWTNLKLSSKSSRETLWSHNSNLLARNSNRVFRLWKTKWKTEKVRNRWLGWESCWNLCIEDKEIMAQDSPKSSTCLLAFEEASRSQSV